MDRECKHEWAMGMTGFRCDGSPITDYNCRRCGARERRHKISREEFAAGCLDLAERIELEMAFMREDH